MTSEVNETRANGASKSSRASAASDENCIRDAINNPPKLLEPLDNQAREDVLSQCTVRRCAKGECIIQEGERGGSFYLIARGRVEVTRLSRDGMEVNFADLEQGEHFGESSLIGHRPHATTITALTDVQLFAMSPQVFRCMTTHYPAMTVVLIKQLLTAQKDMIERMSKQAANESEE